MAHRADPFFWRVWLLTVAVTIAVVAGINYLVDPFSIYGTGLFKPYRDNSYIKKAELFEKLAPSRKALILGSSRMATVDPEVVTELTGKPCFNWAVPSAGVEIISACTRMAVEKYKAPVDLVIVGVDPEAFLPSLAIHAQARLAPMYTPYIGDIGGELEIKEFTRDSLRLITVEQFKASVGVLGREIHGESVTQLIEYRPDGFALYGPREEAIATGKLDLNALIDERLRTYPDRNLCLTGKSTLSESRMDEWVDYLQYCTEHGIRVYVYLPPAHPRYIEMLGRFGALPLLHQLSEFLARTAKENGAVFHDYTDVESFGGDPRQFYDEIHTRYTNNNLLLERLLTSTSQ